MDYTKLKGCHPGGDPVGLKGPDGMNTLSSYQACKDDMITTIKAEIERLKNYAEESKKEWVKEGYNQNAFAEDCRISSFDKLLSFLSTFETEKQKEQKPELVQQPPITYTYKSNASRDERLKAALLALLNSDLLKVKEGGYFTKQDLIEWVERIPTDKPSWSEEDEEMIANIISSLRGYMCVISGSKNYNNHEAHIQKEIEFLNALRPSWKPSEEQMEEAVEGEYDCQYMTPAVFLDKYLDGINDGDKVRVIVIPNTDEK